LKRKKIRIRRKKRELKGEGIKIERRLKDKTIGKGGRKRKNWIKRKGERKEDVFEEEGKGEEKTEKAR